MAVGRITTVVLKKKYILVETQQSSPISSELSLSSLEILAVFAPFHQEFFFEQIKYHEMREKY
jgi:hypothetical protein